MWKLPRFRTNDRVIVRSREEILATLDENSALDGMPFMPEMFQYCGKELRVDAVAHKTCDTAMRTRGRKLDRTVHLTGVRCDGRAHGGCDAGCTIFWREEWLKPADGGESATADDGALAGGRPFGCTEARVEECTRAPDSEVGSPRYRCQSTELFVASRPLPWWHVGQFFFDVTTGNARLGEIVRVLSLNAVYRLRYIPIGYRFWSALYERIHRRVLGRPGPFILGKIRPGDATPVVSRDLRPGETIRIKPASEIALTLNQRNSNRGLWFGPDQAPYCGGTFKVRNRVTRIVNERTGEMIEMKTPCVALEGVTCRGHYSDARFFCPRQILPYWREIWLERAAPPPEDR